MHVHVSQGNYYYFKSSNIYISAIGAAKNIYKSLDFFYLIMGYEIIMNS